jgi:ABC-type glycerol-3-phosphate transport system substrate-binding protein
MKVPKLRFRSALFLTALFATSVAAMVSPVTGQSKDHVDLQFWDMIWGGPEYIDAGKALVAQLNQEHPDITVMLYRQGKHPAESKMFLEWWSEREKDLWTKGHVTQLPTRKSFASDSYFQDNPETKFILQNYVPVGKTTATHATGIFPKLNDVEGEGALQTLSQSLLQAKDVDNSVKTAADRLRSIMED